MSFLALTSPRPKQLGTQNGTQHIEEYVAKYGVRPIRKGRR